ncbi:MAG: M28 family peptidase [bacterium]
MRLTFLRIARTAAAVAALPVSLLAQAKELPLKYSGPPTKPEISAGDLMTRLYIYADDSLMGRQFGSEYNVRATAYIEREVRRMGLQPAGDSGGFFQFMPAVKRALDPVSTITAEGLSFKAGTDFLAMSGGKPRQYASTPVVYGGALYDTVNALPNEAVRGKVVLMRNAPLPGNVQQFVQSAGFRAYQQSLNGAVVVLIASEPFTPTQLAAAMNPTSARWRTPAFDNETPIALNVSPKMAEALLGGPLATMAKGTAGKSITSNVQFHDGPGVIRNVVAVLPGSDPKLKGQYVAIGAHNDHIGFRPTPVDHDSVKAYMQVVMPQGADNKAVTPTAEQMAQVNAIKDAAHKLHGGARADSVSNGADDDGSGTVSVLEIAEAFAMGKVKPKRSIVFVWHTGEESGMLGSGWFTDNPTVPRDSIVAQLNMDMVGRGRVTDATGEAKDGSLLHGGPGYLQLVGSRRLSTELGDLVESVNKEQKLGFNFDYNIDANGHPQNIYCRSDHWSYAKWGIPVVFMTTGGHADYHQVTDEPQYIDYDHMADVSRLVFQTALKVGNLDHRVVVDGTKPDPKGRCVQ